LSLEEVRKLEDYKNALAPAHKKRMFAVLIFGGHHSINDSSWKRYNDSADFRILEWKDIFEKNKKYYDHYTAVLYNHINDPSFKLKENEIINIKKMLKMNRVYRSPADREQGLGSQDLNNKIE